MADSDTAALRAVGELIRGRRTINLYLQTAVPDTLLREAIEAATWAPNHRTTQPWRFYHLGAQSIARCLDLCGDIVRAKKGAEAAAFKRRSWSQKPGWLVVSCQRSADALLQQEDYAACAAAVQNLLLYLWQAGVGSKWTTGDITRDARFFDVIGMDAELEFVVGLIWFGYPQVMPVQQRRDVDDVLTKLP